jgi:hypothetical protein
MIRRVLRCAIRFGLYAGALFTGGVIAFGVFEEPVTGSGIPRTESRTVGSFTELVVSGLGTVELVRGEMPSVRITADDNILPLLETRNHNGKLALGMRSGASLHPVTPITYVVTAPDLKKLHLSGAAHVKSVSLPGQYIDIRVTGAGTATLRDVNCASLKLTLSGAGHATLSGRADRAVLNISGAGDINAGELKATAVEAHVSGAGIISVWATDELKAKVSGAGKVRYNGEPRVEQRVSGAGSVGPS